MKKEIWKQIFNGDYAVSTRGRVRGKRTGALLKPLFTAQGYAKINYHFFDTLGRARRRQYTIHALVALAFIGPRPSGAQINHKDGDKGNNVLENLEYATPGENSRHSTRMGLSPIGERHYRARLTEADVHQIRRAVRGTYSALARQKGVGITTIQDIVHRRSWKHI